MSSDFSSKVRRKMMVLIVNIRISGIRLINVREMTNLWCNNYCNPSLVPQGATISLNALSTMQFGLNAGTQRWNKQSPLIKNNSDGGALPQRPSVLDPDGCGGFSRFLLRHKRAPLKRLGPGGLIAKSAFPPARSPSAAGCTTRRRGRWQRCAEGSCSSSGHWTWGSSGRSLQKTKGPRSVFKVCQIWTDVIYQKGKWSAFLDGSLTVTVCQIHTDANFLAISTNLKETNQWLKRLKRNQQGNLQCWNVLD